MKPLSSWVVAYLTPSFVLLILIAILFIGTPEAQAYEKYSGCKGSVFLDSAIGGNGLAPISYVVCHGREQYTNKNF